MLRKRVAILTSNVCTRKKRSRTMEEIAAGWQLRDLPFDTVRRRATHGRVAHRAELTMISPIRMRWRKEGTNEGRQMIVQIATLPTVRARFRRRRARVLTHDWRPPQIAEVVRTRRRPARRFEDTELVAYTTHSCIRRGTDRDVWAGVDRRRERSVDLR